MSCSFFFPQRSVCESSGRNGQPWTSHLWAAVGWKEGMWLWGGWCCRSQMGSRQRLQSPSLLLVNSLMKKDQSSSCNSGDVLPFRMNPFALSRGCNLETGVWGSNSERSRGGKSDTLNISAQGICLFAHWFVHQPVLREGLLCARDWDLSTRIWVWPG